MWLSVYQDYSDLSDAEKKNLYFAIKAELFPEPKPIVPNKMVGEIREARFSSGLACLHCGSLNVKRNGKYRSRQRYLCKDCNTTYNDLTASPMSGTHYAELWYTYFELMVRGETLPKIAEELDIHVSTAFYWRHKILNAIRRLGFGKLKGIVESDEAFFLESWKGKKKITERKSRKRGGVATQRGLSKGQICVLTAYDRDGEIYAKASGNGKPKAEAIYNLLGGILEEDVLLCTDAGTNYRKFAKDYGYKHEILNGNKNIRVKKGIYHIQHINAYHSNLKQWMVRFKGVSTRYLDNYLMWHRFLEMNRKVPRKEQARLMFLKGCKGANFDTVQSFKSA